MFFAAGFTGATLVQRQAADSIALRGNGISLFEAGSLIGSRLPLLPEIEPRGVIERGDWLVLFYHHDCPACVALLDKFREMAKLASTGEKSDVHLAAVELAPFAQDGDRTSASTEMLNSKLDDSPHWFVPAPQIVKLHDGIIEGTVNNTE
jgi:hypothetical protein